MSDTYDPGDRLQFDGKRTSWLVRAVSDDGRYTLATASHFGEVAYTVLDAQKGIRGPLNVIGGGMGIDTTSGPDEAIDEAMDMLRPDASGLNGYEVSHRNNVPINVTKHKPTTPEYLEEA